MTNPYAPFLRDNRNILIEEHRRGCYDEGHGSGLIRVDAARESFWFYPAAAIEGDLSWAVEAAAANELWVEFLGDGVCVKIDIDTGAILKLRAPDLPLESPPELPDSML